MRIPAQTSAAAVLQGALATKRVAKPITSFDAGSMRDLFVPKIEPAQNIFQQTSKELAFRTSLVQEASEARSKLVSQMRDLRQAMLNPQSKRTGGNGGTPQQIAVTGMDVAGKKSAAQVTFKEQPVFEARNITEARPVYEEREVLETRDVFEMRDVTESRDVTELRNVTEQRDILATRDITEQRDVFEDRPIYNELNVISTIKLNKGKLRDQKIEAGDQFEITVGDRRARVTFLSDTQLSLQVGAGPTKTSSFGEGNQEWRDALVDSLNSIDGLDASITADQYLKLSTGNGEAISLSSGTGDPLAQFGLTSQTYELESATITGTKRLTDLKMQGWKDAGVDRGEAFSVRIGTGATATVAFVSETEIQVDLGNGTPVRSVQFSALLGEWREGLVTALGAIDGLNARFNEAGQLQLSADTMDQVLVVGDVKGDALKDLGLTGGSVSGAITGYEQVKTGEETVVVGQETIKVGEETVVIGQETVKIGEETIVIGQKLVKVGEETIRVSRQVQVSTSEVVTGQELVQVGVARVQVGTDSAHKGEQLSSVDAGRQQSGLPGVNSSDDQILNYRDGFAGRGGDQARAEEFQEQLDTARISFEEMLGKWQSAGFSMELSLDDLALGDNFLASLGTREEIAERAAMLEVKASFLERGLGLTAAVKNHRSENDKMQDSLSPLLVAAQVHADSNWFAELGGFKNPYAYPPEDMTPLLLQKYS